MRAGRGQSQSAICASRLDRTAITGLRRALDGLMPGALPAAFSQALPDTAAFSPPRTCPPERRRAVFRGGKRLPDPHTPPGPLPPLPDALRRGLTVRAGMPASRSAPDPGPHSRERARREQGRRLAGGRAAAGRSAGRPSGAGMHTVRRMQEMRVFRIPRTFRHWPQAISAPLAQSPESGADGPGTGSPDSGEGTTNQKNMECFFGGLWVYPNKGT